MTFSPVSAAVVLVICAAQPVHAQKFDPNAPAKKTVTVGSEWEHGWIFVRRTWSDKGRRLPSLHASMDGPSMRPAPSRSIGI
jgi:hypothetical protein